MSCLIEISGQPSNISTNNLLKKRQTKSHHHYHQIIKTVPQHQFNDQVLQNNVRLSNSLKIYSHQLQQNKLVKQTIATILPYTSRKQMILNVQIMYFKNNIAIKTQGLRNLNNFLSCYMQRLFCIRIVSGIITIFARVLINFQKYSTIFRINKFINKIKKNSQEVLGFFLQSIKLKEGIPKNTIQENYKIKKDSQEVLGFFQQSIKLKEGAPKNEIQKIYNYAMMSSLYPTIIHRKRLTKNKNDNKKNFEEEIKQVSKYIISEKLKPPKKFHGFSFLQLYGQYNPWLLYSSSSSFDCSTEKMKKIIQDLFFEMEVKSHLTSDFNFNLIKIKKLEKFPHNKKVGEGTYGTVFKINAQITLIQTAVPHQPRLQLKQSSYVIKEPNQNDKGYYHIRKQKTIYKQFKGSRFANILKALCCPFQSLPKNVQATSQGIIFKKFNMDLEQFLTLHSNMSFKTKLQILLGVAKSLVIFDKQPLKKIIHNDIKQNNIFIQLAQGKIISGLFDFGAALLTNSQYEKSRNYNHNTPFQVFLNKFNKKQQKPCCQQDIFSFGSLALNLLFNKHFFNSSKFEKVRISEKIRKSQAQANYWKRNFIIPQQAEEYYEKEITGFILRIIVNCLDSNINLRPCALSIALAFKLILLYMDNIQQIREKRFC